MAPRRPPNGTDGAATALSSRRAVSTPATSPASFWAPPWQSPYVNVFAAMKLNQLANVLQPDTAGSPTAARPSQGRSRTAKTVLSTNIGNDTGRIIHEDDLPFQRLHHVSQVTGGVSTLASGGGGAALTAAKVSAAKAAMRCHGRVRRTVDSTVGRAVWSITGDVSSRNFLEIPRPPSSSQKGERSIR